MGEPFFKVKKIVRENNVKTFSTNFSLYGDISRRVMKTLKQSLHHKWKFTQLMKLF